MSMSWGQLSGMLAIHSFRQKIPIIGEFELTARCNLKCSMCYVCRNTHDMEAIIKERTAKEWLKLAGEARDAGMLFLLLTGGEVFLREDFKTIYEEIAMMGFNVTIYTNGTMITPQTASWLGSMAPSQMEISLYGASADTYQKVCGDSGGFARAIRGFELLKSQGINVQLRTTIIPENINDFEQMHEIADNYGVTLGIVNYISPRREEDLKKSGTKRLSPKELAEFEERAGQYLGNQTSDKPCDKTWNYQSEKILNLNQANDEIQKSMQYFNADKEETDSFPCNSGKNSFWITWDGRMVPCSFMDKPETFPFEHGFIPAWEELKRLCSLVPDCKTCGKCSLKEYCTPCPACLFNESGSYEEPGGYLCELARERKNREDKTLKEYQPVNF